jgi:hypothetical protein
MGPATETEMDTLTLAWFTGPPAEGDTPGRGIKTSFHRLRWTVGTCCQTVPAAIAATLGNGTYVCWSPRLGSGSVNVCTALSGTS